MLGRTVYVETPIEGTTDRLGNPVITWTEPVSVDNVLIAPASTDDMEAARVNGYTLALTLHFPKTWTASLQGCRITVGGEVYRVVGDPHPYMDENTPTDWNRPVNVERADG